MIPKWEKTEPVRLYLYTIVGCFLAILAMVGSITNAELQYWVMIVGQALAVTSGTEFARSSVDSPATVEQMFETAADLRRAAKMVESGELPPPDLG